jgi:hypothetical protein
MRVALNVSQVEYVFDETAKSILSALSNWRAQSLS